MAASCGGVAGCVAGPGSALEARTVRLIVIIRKISGIVRFMAVSPRRGGNAQEHKLAHLIEQGEPGRSETVMPRRTMPGGTSGLLAQHIGDAILCVEAEGCSPP